MPVLHKLVEEPQEESPLHSNIRLSDEEMKLNRKITDYFPVRNHPQPPLSPLLRPPHSLPTTAPRSPASPEDSKSNPDDSLKEEVRVLRERLREKEELLGKFRN